MITKEMLRKLSPTANEAIIVHLAENLDRVLAAYDISTYLRICHFLAQAAHESAGFRTLEEFASGADYEGRKDLGNVVPGDGKRYKGRGIFQITGRANYRAMGRKLNLKLEENPQLASDPMVSIQTACEYWKSRNLSAYADLDDVLTITKRINGGTNGLDDRRMYLSKIKSIIPKDAKLSTEKVAEAPKPESFASVVIDTAPMKCLPTTPVSPVVVVADRGDVSDFVGIIQDMLYRKGYKIQTDGNFGPTTESVVRDFQSKVGLQPTGAVDSETLLRLMA